MHKVFVFAFNCEAATLLPHIVSSRLGDRNTVLLLSPAGSSRDNMVVAKVGSFEMLVDMLRERGIDLEFEDRQIHLSSFAEAVSEIALTLKQTGADQLLIDLADALPLLALEIYTATAVYASTLDSGRRKKLQCIAPGPSGSINVFVPVFPLSRFVSLLEELREHPDATLNELQVVLKRHPSTLSRQIGRAKECSLVEKKEGSYKLTEFGEVALKVFLGPG